MTEPGEPNAPKPTFSTLEELLDDSPESVDAIVHIQKLTGAILLSRFPDLREACRVAIGRIVGTPVSLLTTHVDQGEVQAYLKLCKLDNDEIYFVSNYKTDIPVMEVVPTEEQLRALRGEPVLPPSPDAA